MKKWWIKTGCYLIGYNYNIVRNSSEVAAQTVKRYTSALLIVCILWAFVGFNFTSRYIKGDFVEAWIGAFILVVLVVQIERQVILAPNKKGGIFYFRFGIAFLMAIIGSVILDQIIFKEDIEQEKIQLLEKKVEKVYPSRSKELHRQILELGEIINKKEEDAKIIQDDVKRNPMIKSINTQMASIPLPITKTDSLGGTVTDVTRTNSYTTTTTSVPNPNISLLDSINSQITAYRLEKNQKDKALLDLRNTIEAEYKSKVGFIDELNILKNIVFGSGIALFVWFIWFFLLLGLELFIVVSKWKSPKNDYDETIQHQMQLQIKQLELLAQAGMSK